jgi:hypothetical protein
MTDTTDPMIIARRLYLESLRAIDTEIAALLGFAKDFRGEESSRRLTQAQALIQEEALS